MLLAIFCGKAEKSNASILAFIFILLAADSVFIVFPKRYFSDPSRIVCRISIGVCLWKNIENEGIYSKAIAQPCLNHEKFFNFLISHSVASNVFSSSN
jgi:hypothetical protein